ncbi:MAG TPA: selenoneine biosynthesis selenosugar synthase SenB [Burkholderiales bacterium]|nr:selenoneine biosynthesis selenosugar synthase SenB [Burkholderiales bacterium]
MKIAIALPQGVAPRSGNRHTAARWSRFLRELGHRVRVVAEWRGGDDDLLLALHARKSAASTACFREQRPAAPLIVALTGTDLYRDIRTSPEAVRALDIATRLAVLQDEGPRALAPRLRHKTCVVCQSSDVRLRHAPSKTRFRVAVLGHLRSEKDPFRAAHALQRIERSAGVEVLQIGAALDAQMRAEANDWESRDPRYRWLGSLPHAAAMRRLASSHLLVVSSVMEGGANVICEAARIGVPVLASRIPGNVGMLGRDYPGYFPLGDDAALARLLERCNRDARFYGMLKSALARRRGLFAPAAERAALKRLLQGLPGRSPAGRSAARR